MLSAVLNLTYLNEKYAVFMGDSEETEEHQTMFGPETHTIKYPSMQISREMWEAFGSPVNVLMNVSDVPTGHGSAHGF